MARGWWNPRMWRCSGEGTVKSWADFPLAPLIPDLLEGQLFLTTSILEGESVGDNFSN